MMWVYFLAAILAQAMIGAASSGSLEDAEAKAYLEFRQIRYGSPQPAGARSHVLRADDGSGHFLSDLVTNARSFLGRRADAVWVAIEFTPEQLVAVKENVPENAMIVDDMKHQWRPTVVFRIRGSAPPVHRAGGIGGQTEYVGSYYVLILANGLTLKGKANFVASSIEDVIYRDTTMRIMNHDRFGLRSSEFHDEGGNCLYTYRELAGFKAGRQP